MLDLYHQEPRLVALERAVDVQAIKDQNLHLIGRLPLILIPFRVEFNHPSFLLGFTNQGADHPQLFTIIYEDIISDA